ncbi:hypothetical protein [Streptomyces longisporoflavus]|uniref:hypothetical protein n=1 Tax=Streptomyces longisporoflavus TaxID=28044 RepID=UPI00167E38C5|nr:hypothetical protein [Streptomyces longisporoflavus]
MELPARRQLVRFWWLERNGGHGSAGGRPRQAMRDRDEPRHRVYVCLGRAAQYLPPASMTYSGSGLDASPVHCANAACRSVASASMEFIPVPAESVAKWARRAAGVGGPVRRGRPGRIARGRRADASPGAGRSKL